MMGPIKRRKSTEPIQDRNRVKNPLPTISINESAEQILD
jgi:hypothetical protein